MKVIGLVFFLFFLFTFESVFSQQLFLEIDSLKHQLQSTRNVDENINIFNQLAFDYNKSNLDSALYYSQKAIKLSVHTKSSKLLADAYYLIGVTYKNINISDSANYYLFNALKEYEKINDLENEIKTNIAIGEYYRHTGIYSKAIQFEKKAIILSKSNEILTYLPSAYNRLGAIYFELSFKNDGFDNYYKDTINKAISYVDSSTLLSKEINTNIYNVSNNNILGACYKTLKEFDKANICLTDALFNAEINDELIEMPMIYRNLALNLFDLKQYNKAIEMGNLGARMGDSLGLKTSSWLNYHALFQIYSEIKDYKNALENLERAYGLKTAIYDETTASKAREFEIKFRNKANELFITQQSAELDKKQKLFIFSLVGLFTALIIIIGGILFGIRLKKINKILGYKNNEIEVKNIELAKLNQFKDDLNGMIVHDLKNPLNSIINFSKLIEKEKNLDKIPERIEDINNSALYMLEIVENLIDLQKLKHAKISIVKIKSLFSNTLNNALKNINWQLKQKNIKIHNKVDNTLISEYDNGLIERVLTNLLSNAIKFSPNNGDIYIENEILNNFIKIKVTDNGPGISAEAIPTLFNEFARSEIRHLGYTTSSGLGLAYSKLVINAHRGEIGVDSEYGEGSCFWFTLRSV